MLGLSLVAATGGCSLAAALRLLTVVASLAVGHGLQARGLSRRGSCALSTGSVVLAHRLHSNLACGIFLDQGSNLCPLHWQANSYPLYHQGNPALILEEKL